MSELTTKPWTTRARGIVSRQRRFGDLGQSVIVLAPPALFLLIFFVIPLVFIVLVSFLKDYPGGSIVHVTLHNYTTMTRPFYADYIVTTATYGLLVTALALLIGYPMAYYMVRRRGLEYQLILLSVIAPLLAGVVPRTVGWTILLGVEGLVNKALLAIGIVSSPVQLLYRESAAVIGMVHVLLPFMVLSIASVLMGISATLHEAADSLGASRWQIFWRVTFPLSIQGVAVGCALVFSLAVGAYITPVVLGGGKMRLLAPYAYDQFMSVVNWPFASALSVVLLILALVFVIGVPAIMSRRGPRRRV